MLYRVFWIALFTLVVSSSIVLADDTNEHRKGFEVRLASTRAEDEFEERVELNGEVTLYLQAEPVITDRDVTAVVFSKADWPTADITLIIAGDAAQRLERVSRANLGKRLAITLDGKVITAPTIRSPISTEARITGRFSDEELTRFFTALVLQSESEDIAGDGSN